MDNLNLAGDLPVHTYPVQLSALGSLNKAQRPKSKSLQPCQCPLEGCGKMFSKRSNLKAHMRVHSGVLPYPCEYPGCDKRFRWKSSLKPHVKVHIAAGQTPLSTTPCSSSVADSSLNASNHSTMIQRTNATPYSNCHTHNSPADFLAEKTSPITPEATLDARESFGLSATHFAELNSGLASPTAITDSSFFENTAVTNENDNHAMTKKSGRMFECTHRGCDAQYDRISNLSAHESLTGHTSGQPTTARILFPEDQTKASDENVDLSCDSVLSASPATSDCGDNDNAEMSFTLTSPGGNGSMPIPEDLWRVDLNVMDPFGDLGEEQVLEMLSPVSDNGMYSINDAAAAAAWLLQPSLSSTAVLDIPTGYLH